MTDAVRPPSGTAVTALECVRCGTQHPVGDYPLGCPSCAAAGHGSNLFCRYPTDAVRQDQLVPYPVVPNLGQGHTPLFPLPWLDGVLVKNEAANPTGSHKDRFAAMVVTHAKVSGYERVVVGSSGNAGLATAAFAAAVGLRAVVAGFTWLPESLAGPLRGLGADLRTFDTDEERVRYVKEAAARDDSLAVSNVADIVIGSSCFGIEGYKAIAWEIAANVPGGVDDVVIPSSRGDLAWGIHLGFTQWSALTGGRVPRLHLVEPFPRLSEVLAGRDVATRFPDSAGSLHSIAGDSTTVQAHAAVTRSAGSVVVVREDVATGWYERAGRHGHTWEISSCTVLAAYDDLRRRGVIPSADRTVLITTSHLFKGL
ncbi:pyridoxal-phosphate dependent enzyme [Micromonospora sp. NPDC048935]|uniref:threonine synthase n=1 Tax=Micromonospora sp. NPDC048935 TaxID=3364262 RepID=UPI00371BFA13